MFINNKIGCSNCGWNETVGDIHHIKGRKIPDADNHENLSYLCPNCHRKAHRGLLKEEELINLQDQFGDKWKEYYDGTIRKKRKSKEISKERKEKKDRGIAIIKKRENRIKAILESGIDFEKFGWVKEVSKLTGINHQSVGVWMKRNMLEFYNENCFVRKPVQQ